MGRPREGDVRGREGRLTTGACQDYDCECDLGAQKDRTAELKQEPLVQHGCSCNGNPNLWRKWVKGALREQASRTYVTYIVGLPAWPRHATEQLDDRIQESGVAKPVEEYSH